MKNLRINKKVPLLIMVILLVLTIGPFFSTNFNTVYAISSGQEIQIIEKSYDDELLSLSREAVLTDYFEDDKVIVILKEEFSERNGDTVEFKESINSIGTISVTDVSGGSKSENSDRISNFRQIVTIELQEKGKSNVLKTIAELEKNDMVLLAQPSYIYDVIEDWKPNDPYYNQQWGLNKIHGIQAENAWNITRGTGNVVVGIMESGFQLDHVDLNGKSVTGNFTPNSGIYSTHGTHVAGIVSGISNNHIGIGGVSQASFAPISPSNFVDALDWADDNEVRVINASFFYANPITGLPAGPDASHRQRLENYDGILIAAAGNSGRGAQGNTDITPQYPSGYGNETLFPNVNNVISVGSLDNVATTRAQRSDFSNYGTNSVHIYAPGGNILSTYPISVCEHEIIFLDNTRLCEFSAGDQIFLESLIPSVIPSWEVLINNFNVYFPGHQPADFKATIHHDDGYHFMSGTSMAAPHVAGVAALLLSVNFELTPVQLRDQILNNADSIIIQVPTTPGGTNFVDQTVRRLNAFRVVSSIAFDVSYISGGISINGLAAGLSLSSGTNLTFPDKIAPLGTTSQQSVKAIGSNAFSYNSHLVGINIPSSVTLIGDYAFANCNNLESVSLPNMMPNITMVFGITPFNGSSKLFDKTIYTDFLKHGIIDSFGNVNFSNHTFIYTPRITGSPFMKQHFSDCDCGYSRIDPCIGEAPTDPHEPVFCVLCGQQMSGSMWYSITLSNGKTYISNTNITVEDILVLTSLLQLNMTYNEINILVILANRDAQCFSLEGNDLHEHNHIY